MSHLCVPKTNCVIRVRMLRTNIMSAQTLHGEMLACYQECKSVPPDPSVDINWPKHNVLQSQPRPPSLFVSFPPNVILLLGKLLSGSFVPRPMVLS